LSFGLKHISRIVLNRNQKLNCEELKIYQLRALKKLLKHAYSHTKYYNDVFNSLNIHPDNIKSLSDFRKIPILRKTDIQSNFKNLLANNISTQNLTLDSTGGSTGNPLNFYHDKRAKIWKKAAFRRFRKWIGYDGTDKIAYIWGSTLDKPVNPRSTERWLNAFDCSSEEMENFIIDLVEWKPVAIRAYPSMLYLLASYIRANNLEAPEPRTIETGAEKLYPEQKQLIEEIFGCSAFEQYGSREMPAIACECEYHHGMHVFSDLRIVEIIKNDKPVLPGEEGSIVITDLTNYVMPLIRYEIGDVGKWSNRICECGRGFPILEEVIGRTMNLFPLPDGRFIYGGYFNHFFFNTKGIRSFQVHQKAVDFIEIIIEPNKEFKPHVADDIIRRISEMLGDNVRMNWRIVDKIEPLSSGKQHFTISDVPIELIKSEFIPIETTERQKLKILFIVDTPGWAHDIKTDNLIKCLGNQFEITKVFQSELTEKDMNESDLILIFFWLQLKSLKHLYKAFKRNYHKTLVGICSHHELTGSKRGKGLRYLRKFAKGIFANSMLLYNEFKPLFDKKFYYTPNGVDTNFYQPPEEKSSSDILRVGWAGSRSNQGSDHRGIDTYIEPAVARIEGTELVTAIREEKWRNTEEMREFYHNIDVYICASRSEGTPNPCLEAAACGVPLLTTRVGNMPELVIDGKNSLLIERDIDLIISKLELLKNDKNLYTRLAVNIRKSVEEWDWNIMAENYRNMFVDFLAD